MEDKGDWLKPVLGVSLAAEPAGTEDAPVSDVDELKEWLADVGSTGGGAAVAGVPSEKSENHAARR